MGVDDPVGALSVHMVNGIFGTFALGLFADPTVCPAASVVKKGLFLGGGLEQLLPQVVGIIAVGAFVFLVSIGGWAILKATVGLRVSRDEELEGLDIGEHGNYAYPYFQMATIGERSSR